LRREVALLQGAPDEGARFVPIEGAAGLELARVFEEREEELSLVGLRPHREAAGTALELAPGGAHLGPERLGGGKIALRGAEVVVLDALVARHAVFAGED